MLTRHPGDHADRRWMGHGLLVLVAPLLVLVGLGAAPAPVGEGPDHVPGSLLVTVAEGAAVGDVLARGVEMLGHGDDPIEVVASHRLADRVGRVLVPAERADDATRRLHQLDGVHDVEPDWLLDHARSPDDPWYPQQWGHGRTGIQGAWDRTTGSRDVIVAVIDSGMRGDHPDLRPNIVGQVDVSTGTVAGPERVGIDNDTCDAGHGTWVGGVVGAVGDNARDVSGVAWQVGLLDLAANSTRAGASCDGIPFSAIIAGMDHAVSDPTRLADVINLSLTGYLDRCPSAMAAAVTQVRDVGTAVVASVGNGQADAATAGRIGYPAGCDGVIGVGATGEDDVRAGYSQVNGTVDLVAPGGDVERGGVDGAVLTTNHAFSVNSLTRVQGTSFSAPYVAGALALLRTVQPVAGPDSLQDVLQRTARDLGPAGRDDQYGHGLVRVGAAVASATTALPDAPDATAPRDSDSSTDDSGDRPDPEPAVRRVAGGTPTTPIDTAVALSREAFPTGGARHVVLARDDVFADALAGSTLGGGEGPLLYTRSTGPLAVATRRELERVLPDGGRVYLLGGPDALPSGLEDELERLGHRPRRLAGATREDTAATVAVEASRRRRELGGSVPSQVILATSGSWPDAATAGSLGATFGIPVVLTPTDRLDAAAAAYLEHVAPRVLYVAGGPVAISDATAARAAETGGSDLVRLAGATRVETALRVAELYDRRHLAAAGQLPRFAMAVNMYRPDAWAYTLAASALSGQSTGVFVPVDGTEGDSLGTRASDYVRDRRRGDETVLGLVIGGPEVVDGRVARRLEELLGS